MKSRMKRRIVLAVVLVMLASTLAGCGGMKPDEAKAYVQAVLDAGYKGEVEEYVKITDSSKEDAEKLSSDSIDTALSLSGIEQAGITDELLEKYRELFKSILAKVHYEVGEAKETEEGFEVTVSAEPMQLYDGIEDALIEELTKRVKDSEEQLSEDDIQKLGFEVMYDMLAEKMSEPTYGEAKEVIVHITKSSDNVWSVSEADLKTLDEALYDVAG